jgi:hypothetical protein
MAQHGICGTQRVKKAVIGYIETAALTLVLKEGMFVMGIATFIGARVSFPIHAITDNKATFDTVKQPGATKKTAHYERWLYYARDLSLHNKLIMFLVETAGMMADMFTKVADKVVFAKCRAFVMNLQ